MTIDAKRPAKPVVAPPPSSRRPGVPIHLPPPGSRPPNSERTNPAGPGFAWILAPHPGRVRGAGLGQGGILGRADDAVLRLDAPGVAPHHARVELAPREGLPPEIMVTDLGTTSGIYVSGMRAQRTVLADGDLLRVGGAIALVVDKDIGTYDGSVIDEGGLVRGPRSRKGWFAALEKALELPREARRVVVRGPAGSGRHTIARRLAEGWGGTVAELSAEDEDAVLSAAARGTAIVSGIEGLTPDKQVALARQIERRKGLVLVVIVESAADAPTAGLVPELAAVLATTITLPSIEQRREEIPSLVRVRFEKSGVAGNRLSIELYEALTRAAWPGEIRELVETVDQIAAAHPSEPRLGPEHLVRGLSRRGGRAAPKPTAAESPSDEARIRGALETAKGSVAAAARALHMSRQALYREAARLGIDIRRVTGAVAEGEGEP